MQRELDQEERVQTATEAVKRFYEQLVGPILLTDGDNYFYSLLQQQSDVFKSTDDRQIASQHAEQVIHLFSQYAQEISPLKTSDVTPQKIREGVRQRGGSFDETYGENATHYVTSKDGAQVLSALFTEPRPYKGIHIVLSASAENVRGLFLKQRLVESALQTTDYAYVWPWRGDVIRRQEIPFESWTESQRQRYEGLHGKVNELMAGKPVEFSSEEQKTLASIIRMHESYKLLGFEPVLHEEGESRHNVENEPISYLYRNPRYDQWRDLRDELDWTVRHTLSEEQLREYSQQLGIPARPLEIENFRMQYDAIGEKRIEVVASYLLKRYGLDVKKPLDVFRAILSLPFGKPNKS